MKKHFGMVVAIEIDAVTRKYGEPKAKQSIAGIEFLTFESENAEITVAHTGAGEISAALGTQLLITVFGAETIINFGVVGALTEDMATTEICVIEKAVHYDFDACDWLGIPKGQYPEKDGIYYYADGELIKKAVTAEPRLKKVTCASADKFVASPDAKKALNAEYGADICEMEAAGIMITCEKNGIPCLLIKAISDSLNGSNTEFFKELERVSEICFDVADTVIKSL